MKISWPLPKKKKRFTSQYFINIITLLQSRCQRDQDSLNTHKKIQSTKVVLFLFLSYDKHGFCLILGHILLEFFGNKLGRRSHWFLHGEIPWYITCCKPQTVQLLCAIEMVHLIVALLGSTTHVLGLRDNNGTKSTEPSEDLLVIATWFLLIWLEHQIDCRPYIEQCTTVCYSSQTFLFEL